MHSERGFAVPLEVCLEHKRYLERLLDHLRMQAARPGRHLQVVCLDHLRQLQSVPMEQVGQLCPVCADRVRQLEAVIVQPLLGRRLHHMRRWQAD